ncbi:hypothetical protein [Rubrivirga sp. IMCC43871]|uniref:hypothetical protein n=1 Tax=Rubrivirga sp. IMCC43871 TaxID=3391575 RepID=UPI00398FC1EA
MSRPRFLFNVPRVALVALVELAKEAGGAYPFEAAVADLQLTIDAGKTYGQRTYAMRWRWGYKRVRGQWPDLTAEAARRATVDGRQLDNPAARNVPADWLENAGLATPKGAIIDQDAIRNADPGRTSAGGAHRGRTKGAPGAQESTPGAPPTPSEGAPRAQQGRTEGADLPSLIPHPVFPNPNPRKTDRPDPAREAQADRASRSVGLEKNDRGNPEVVARLRQLGETDRELSRKVADLDAQFPGRVLPMVRELEAQDPATIRSPFGWLRTAVRRDSQGQHRRTVESAPQLVDRETYPDSVREKAVEAGVPAGHFYPRGTDGRGRPQFMYLPNGPRPSLAANLRQADPEPSGDGAASPPPGVASLADLADLAALIATPPPGTSPRPEGPAPPHQKAPDVDR